MNPLAAEISTLFDTLKCSTDISHETMNVIDTLNTKVSELIRLNQKPARTHIIAPFLKPNPLVAKKNPVYQNRHQEHMKNDRRTKIEVIGSNKTVSGNRNINSYPVARALLDEIPQKLDEKKSENTPVLEQPTSSRVSTTTVRSQRSGTISLEEAMQRLPRTEADIASFLHTLPISILKKMCKKFECKGHSRYNKKHDIVQFMLDKIDFDLK